MVVSSWKSYIVNRWLLFSRLLLNKGRRFIYKRPGHQFLFVLAAPHSGSTLLVEILLLSPEVSGNNPIGTKEGQQLPVLREIMLGEKERWKSSKKLDWKRIKRVWMRYWDVTKPILLEKSPPNLVRAAEIEKEFIPSYFIILVRNPYAHCESLIRRNKTPAARAARIVLMTLQKQRVNDETLERRMVLRYENLTEEPDVAIDRMITFLPGLKRMEISQKEFSPHNYSGKKMGIKNLNPENINRLSPEDIAEINSVLKSDESVMHYWGYSYIESSFPGM